MKRINKKGFTLVELIAVVVVLIIVFLIAMSKIRNSSLTAKKKAISANAISYMKLVKDKAGEDVADNELLDSGVYSVDDLKDMGIKLSGRTPDSGYVLINDFDIISYCLVYDEYKVTNVEDTDTVVEGNCFSDLAEMNAYYNENIYPNLDLNKYEYSYLSNNYQLFTAPVKGKYKIELWGAKGGNNPIGVGNGAYTSGEIVLQKNQKVYLYIGSKGGATRESVSEYIAGGYNGGGYTNGQSCCGRTYGSGGGATDIRIFSSQPSEEDLVVDSENGLNSRVMVAAGGGGGFNGSGGGYAGGLKGQNAQSNNGYGPGGGATQTAGGVNTRNSIANGSFGKGGSGGNSGLSTGGGGGYYGGAGSEHIDAAGGGSSYISGYSGCASHSSGIVFLNPEMKAGNESMPSYTNEAMTGNEGNGYVRITMLFSLGV
ncbi:MAG: prepilin-type N-terminal cleavage/methylation domain-containing protein [Bacilli bacterium]|nr:prepilin-type N-terminal cleavage/methylation domain-containing protein [Bacilli bacterium]